MLKYFSVEYSFKSQGLIVSIFGLFFFTSAKEVCVCVLATLQKKILNRSLSVSLSLGNIGYYPQKKLFNPIWKKIPPKTVSVIMGKCFNRIQ